jgi:hypothetical protein
LFKWIYTERHYGLVQLDFEAKFSIGSNRRLIVSIDIQAQKSRVPLLTGGSANFGE